MEGCTVRTTFSPPPNPPFTHKSAQIHVIRAADPPFTHKSDHKKSAQIPIKVFPQPWFEREISYNPKPIRIYPFLTLILSRAENPRFMLNARIRSNQVKRLFPHLLTLLSCSNPLKSAQRTLTLSSFVLIWERSNPHHGRFMLYRDVHAQIRGKLMADLSVKRRFL